MKTALVCGAGGFIGGHMVKRLKDEGYWVRGVDIKQHEFCDLPADDFVQGDLRDPEVVARVIDEGMDEIYQFAADMGGAGFVFSGENDATIMHNSALCNLNVVHEAVRKKVGKIFYSSSACVYPEDIQMETSNPGLKESDVYPARPDSEYGWEKLFSERMYAAYHRNFGLEIHIARFHNIFGPEGTWTGGREKAPAAMCRKVAEAEEGGEVEIWGDGEQTRSFLYIDECIEGVRRLMESDVMGPLNIGSDEMISINDLALMAAEIAGKSIRLKHVPGPLGVRGRNSENTRIEQKLGWRPVQPLRKGMEKTYRWVGEQVRES
ncbi:NAD-dependent epimerase/dehydratase family protein [Kiritimatiella glycovorans]|uniref:dTDP-4-dehydro-6-deoxyglucose reductase n=1 Tax=Kiritimatiella glycovorans TaxID=1307763 RepID=A0A0G3EL67_9BACT|nr:NAD-dependent epimerase/dehydratase family protein [Kiritimatiella glycovorans]AKJ65510.1 dTDP-4-dehydro-6-deoxyglucose reductase [Kiritimatiella glycovorans]